MGKTTGFLEYDRVGGSVSLLWYVPSPMDARLRGK